MPAALAEVERRVAWLRLLAIPLIVAAETLPHPKEERSDFLIGVGVVSAYAVVMLVWVYKREVTPRFGILGTALDVAAITVLVVLSGGAYSEARLTYFLVPIAVAFRFRPGLTALSSTVTVIAYVLQAVAHPAHTHPQAAQLIAVQAGYLLLIGLAAVLLSAVLDQRTRQTAELAERRRGLIAEALRRRRPMVLRARPWRAPMRRSRRPSPSSGRPSSSSIRMFSSSPASRRPCAPPASGRRDEAAFASASTSRIRGATRRRSCSSARRASC